ncbi:MAG: sensor histidine kinase [Paracoccaceae bacterium]
MRRGLSLSWRVGLILVVGVMASWFALISVAYIGRGYGEPAALASPLRLAAIVDVIERTPAAERSRLLTALRTPHVAVWVEPEPLGTSVVPDLTLLDAMRVEAYRAALAGRRMTISPHVADRPLGALMASALSAVEFRIGLAGGETLVVTSESPFIVAPVGLPVGFGAGLVGVLVALGTLIVLHREFRPLRRLAVAVDRVDPSFGTPPLPEIRTRSPEVRALVAAFERLQGRIDTLVRARLALVGGIQHDLRTFATRLRLRVEQIPDAADRARADADIADMIALLDDALLTSRAGASELDEELLDLRALVAAEVADRRTAGAPVALAPGPDRNGSEAMVLGDRLALRRILANLIDNAVAYGQRAEIRLVLSAREVMLTVDDAGPGIPPDRRSLLLEPFTRTETSRARRTGGSGLGLAVVRSLAEAHGGTVAIGDAPSGGARLTVTLPRFRPGGAGSALTLTATDQTGTSSSART